MAVDKTDGSRLERVFPLAFLMVAAIIVTSCLVEIFGRETAIGWIETVWRAVAE